jgi:ubiquitin-protein ligase
MTSQYSSVFGMYVFYGLDDINRWHGFVLVKEGVYKGARIKFIVDFPVSFPAVAPEIHLLTKLLHPLVADDGRVDVESIVPKWVYGEKCQVFDLLMKFRRVFSELSFLKQKNSFNPDAAILFDTNPDLFLEKAARDATASADDFDNHYEACPYRHSPRPLPEAVRAVLDSQLLTAEEKKLKIKQLILHEAALPN